MLLRDLNRNEINQLLHNIWRLSEDAYSRKEPPYSHNRTTTFEQFTSGSERDKIDIIGGLPFLLLSKKYFKDRRSIAIFAEKYLNIPSKRLLQRKRSTRELIGLIVTEVAEMEPKRLSEFRKTLARVLGKVEKGEVEDFFTEWDEAIKSLRAR